MSRTDPDRFEREAREFLRDNPWLATICSSHEPALVEALALLLARVAAEERVTRDRLWCAALVKTLDTEEIESVTAEFNRVRPDAAIRCRSGNQGK